LPLISVVFFGKVLGIDKTFFISRRCFVYKRKIYLDRIEPFIGKPVVKVITGMRRVGKSVFLKQIIEHLHEKNVRDEDILYIDKELLAFDFLRDYRDLETYITEKLPPGPGQKYLLVDEIQEIDQWERVINSRLNQGELDIFITGSNAHLLSSDLATLISGRYIQFPLYSLGFSEFLQFRGENKGALAGEFQHYLRYGGLPGIHNFAFESVSPGHADIIYQYIRSIYDTILIKDIIRRHSVRNVYLLENINHYIFDNIGSIFSSKRVSDYLKSERLKIGVDTVQNYISFLLGTFSVFKVPRFDIKGKRLLEYNEKYFAGDIGMRNAILSYRAADISGILENIVFLELKRRGYRVTVVKLDNLEIDFIAERDNKRL